MPYRESRVEVPRLAPDPGIVDDMVRQFADPYAYLRELVQNGIDAGATRILVRIERDEMGIVTTAVDDDGSGMARATIEGPLLTLFSSSKESDASKIGKYGIGFVSVFATKPDRVEVTTRHEHETWHLRLLGDHSFELRGGAREARGTTVTLFHVMSSEQLREHVQRTTAALYRWCRHAQLPIELDVVDLGDASNNGHGSPNAPFTTPGLVVVRAAKNGMRAVVGVGPKEAGAEGETTFAGFYNRGLTLSELSLSTDDLDRIRFKVDSPRLTHTLSRDAVKADAGHAEAIAWVRELVEGPLIEALIARSKEAASTANLNELGALYEAAMGSSLSARREAFELPLVERWNGRATLSCLELAESFERVYVALESSPITRALARQGTPVVRFVELGPVIGPLVHRPIFEAEIVFGFVSAEAVEGHPGDDALLDRLRRLLEQIGRSTQGARLATFHGAAKNELFRVVETDALTALDHATARELGKAQKRAWSKKATVFLNVEDAYVRLARRRAKDDARSAAHLLCRSLLLVDGPLAKRDVDRLLAAEAK